VTTKKRVTLDVFRGTKFKQDTIKIITILNHLFNQTHNRPSEADLEVHQTTA